MSDTSSKNTVEWHKVYTLLASSLKQFYSSMHYPAVELYLLASTSDLIKNKKWFLNFSKYETKCIDPVHVFASFNRHKQRRRDKIDLINEWFKLLKSSENFDDISFDGCPSPFTVRILSARLMREQNDIWGVFNDVLSDKNYILDKEIESKLKSWYGLKLPSFTIFLFWIAPNRFLSLDKNTVSYLLKTIRIKATPKNISTYNELLKEIPKSEYISIVRKAYGGNYDRHENETTAIDRFQSQREKQFEPNRNYTRLIGIEVFENCPKQYRKSLNPKIYHFYSDYSIQGDKIQPGSSWPITDIYSVLDGSFSIHVNAVVGKNGSGKSALIELILMAINNIYIKCAPDKESDFIEIKDLKIALYYEAFGLYKIEIDGPEIKRYRYDLDVKDKCYNLNKKEIELDMDFLASFFYTITLNYSLHGLNSTHNKKWLENLFVKNDGYENPIVIEPYREKGNVNINNQNSLLRSRFLANLVDLIEIETKTEEQNIQIPLNIVDNPNKANYKYVSSLISDIHEVKSVRLKLLKDKTTVILRDWDIQLKTKKSLISSQIEVDFIIDSIVQYFNLGETNLHAINFDDTNQIESIALRYLIKKIIKISRTYEPYKSKYSELDNQKTIAEYIELLSKDFSHITYKIHQTIHFLAKRSSFSEGNYEIDALDALIVASRINGDEVDERSMKTIHLIPPPFFETEIFVTDIFDPENKEFPFEELSSGQRQHLFSIHTILYHLKNINSIISDERIPYLFAHIILDEVELYAHPDMQRKYLSDLLNLIKLNEWESLDGISICFITHSPFILSDITHDRILFLKNENELVQVNETKTFGANIHELLSNAFFLKSTIGEFAQQKIQAIVSFHQKIETATSEQLIELKEEYKELNDEFRYIVNNIGEKYIHGILSNHLDKLDDILLNSEKKKLLKIEKLQKEIDNLKKDINAKN